MSKFIEVETKFGVPMLVNIDKIHAVREFEGTGAIVYGDDSYVSVKESYEQIRGMIYKAQGGRVLPVKGAAV